MKIREFAQVYHRGVVDIGVAEVHHLNAMQVGYLFQPGGIEGGFTEVQFLKVLQALHDAQGLLPLAGRPARYGGFSVIVRTRGRYHHDVLVFV